MGQDSEGGGEGRACDRDGHATGREGWDWACIGGVQGETAAVPKIVDMPNYDYVCEKCEHQFEVFQSMNDDKLTDCPQEGCAGKVRRLLGTGAGIIFKGGGFYETDYRSESYKKGAKSEAEASKPKESKSEGGKSGSGSSDSAGGGAAKSEG
tara:strand:+ start:170 stop:625 length:456 start_codon:yes stop_codon:yes gene_type:complete